MKHIPIYTHASCEPAYQLRSLLPDHIHFTLGVDYESSAADIALSYMNNIAYKHSMSRLFMDSYYVGTVGAYTMAAVRKKIADSNEER